MVLKPGSSAIISIIMGEYLVRAAIGAEAENVSAWINKSVALAGLLAVTLLNCISTKLGTRMGDMFMFFKFVALLGVTVVGIVVAITGFSASGQANQDWKTIGWFEGTSTSASSWAVALYAGLWAFDGWDNVSKLSDSMCLANINRQIMWLESSVILPGTFPESSIRLCRS